MYIATKPHISDDLELILAILVPFAAILLISLGAWVIYRLKKQRNQPHEIIAGSPYGSYNSHGSRTLASSSFYSPVWPDNKRFSSHIRETIHDSPLDLTKTDTITPPVPALLPSSSQNADYRSSIRLVESEHSRNQSGSDSTQGPPQSSHSRTDSRRNGFLIEHEPPPLDANRFSVDTFWQNCQYRQVDNHTMPGLAF